ncbi:hypothetical protein [Sphingobacterium deserti]|nr:hypothetical protein [Sphingobacterium deserti]
MNRFLNYLSDLLRMHTGRNTQQHINQRLIERAGYKSLTPSQEQSTSP